MEGLLITKLQHSNIIIPWHRALHHLTHAYKLVDGPHSVGGQSEIAEIWGVDSAWATYRSKYIAVATAKAAITTSLLARCQAIQS